MTPLMLHRYRDMIQELWGIGLTVVPRAVNEKAFDLADGLAPPGMAYQWCANQKLDGWSAVPASRHPGLFAPYGYTGDIEINGCWLMERPQAEVDAFHANAYTKVRQNVDDWLARTGAMGFTGGVTVLQEGSGDVRNADVREIGDKTTENVTQIPPELMPHISRIFRIRDSLWESSDRWWGKPTPEYAKYTELAAANPTWMRGQIMNAVLTPIAIEQTRTYLATEGAQHEQRTDDREPTAGDARQDGTPDGTIAASPPRTPSKSTG